MIEKGTDLISNVKDILVFLAEKVFNSKNNNYSFCKQKCASRFFRETPFLTLQIGHFLN